ncbi:MAG TPA: zinc ribbon domain-containing protein [Candidatus Binatia bacterium]|nr:zinc ribbon domain-containing protein [Candidatus Binatia bacterium]
MEPPNSWDRLTASLAVCDLSKPYRAWAFLVLQGLVRDLPGDRENFIGFVKQEREKEITGPSLASRIAGLLDRSGISRPESHEPDPEAELAFQRFSVIRQWVNDAVESPMSGEFVYCIHCGLHYEVGSNFAVCPQCRNTLPDRSATVGKPCSSCRNMNLLYARFCEYCGQSLDAPPKTPETPAPAMPEAPNYEAETWWNKVRGFRLFGISTSPQEVAQRTADLWHVLRSVIQDIAVMKAMMQEKGVWDEAKYKELRVNRMVSDHSGAGPAPWTQHSYHPYTLNEGELLTQHLGADEEEVKRFKHRVESAERLS